MKPDGAEEEPFVREARLRARRARVGRPMSFWDGLTLAGSVGWMVTLPAVGGALLGRYLDARFESGAFWTLSLLLSGLAAGCLAAWRSIHREAGR